MALSPRERLIAMGVGAAAVLYIGNKYALEPYVQARETVAVELETAQARNIEVQRVLKMKKHRDTQWRAMLAGGLKTDQSAAQFQVFDAIGDWAQEAGVKLTSRTPQPETRNDRTQIIRLNATGTCNSAAAAKLLWRVETAPMPMKVDELTLTSVKPGSDELQITLVVSTVWVRPSDPNDKTTGAGGTQRRPVAREQGV